MAAENEKNFTTKMSMTDKTPAVRWLPGKFRERARITVDYFHSSTCSTEQHSKAQHNTNSSTDCTARTE